MNRKTNPARLDGYSQLLLVIIALIAAYIACRVVTTFVNRYVVTTTLVVIYVAVIIRYVQSIKPTQDNTPTIESGVYPPLSHEIVFPSSFLVEPSNSKVLLGESRRVKRHVSESSALSVISVFLVCAVQIAYVYAVTLSIVTTVQISSVGLSTEATVIACRVENEKQTTYSLDYRFTALDGHDYEASWDTTQSICQQTPVGSHITRTYLPDDPTAQGLIEPTAPLGAIVLFTVWFIGFAHLSVERLHSYVQIKKLQAHGILIPGEIVYIEASGRKVFLAYKFRTPDGDKIQGRIAYTPRHYIQLDLLHEGDPLAILFVSNDCFRVL